MHQISTINYLSIQDTCYCAISLSNRYMPCVYYSNFTVQLFLPTQKFPVYSQTPNPEIYWGTDLGISSSVASPESTDSFGDGRPLVSARQTWHVIIKQYYIVLYKWLRGRALDSQQRGPRFESCAAVLKPWASFFTLLCCCINEYMAINCGGWVYEQSLRISCSIWLDVYQRSWDGVSYNRSARKVKCKYKELTFPFYFTIQLSDIPFACLAVDLYFIYGLTFYVWSSRPMGILVFTIFWYHLIGPLGWFTDFYLFINVDDADI